MEDKTNDAQDPNLNGEGDSEQTPRHEHPESPVKTSIWRIFKRELNGLAKCTICSKSFKTPGSNTSTIKRHAQNNHPEQFRTTTYRNQPHIGTAFGIINKYASDSIIRNKINRSLIK